MLRHGGTLPTPRSLLSPHSQSEQSEFGENQIYKRESNEDSLVPEGVSLQVPPQVMDEDEMDSAALRRGMESYIERGPLFEGLDPRRGVSKKKRRLSAREAQQESLKASKFSISFASFSEEEGKKGWNPRSFRIKHHLI